MDWSQYRQIATAMVMILFAIHPVYSTPNKLVEYCISNLNDQTN